MPGLDELEVACPSRPLSPEDLAAILGTAEAPETVQELTVIPAQETQAEGVHGPSPVFKALRHVIHAIHTGTGIDGRLVGSLIHSQDKRAQLVDQLLLTRDYERATALAEARASLEAGLIKSCQDPKLSLSVRLLLLEQVTGLEDAARKRIKGGSINIQDLEALLEKVNYATEAGEADLATKFANTTPQGREIIRKVVTRLGKAVRTVVDDTE